MLKWLLCCLLSLPVIQVGGQQPFRFINAEDGLPSNQIYNLMRDTKGYLWMGHSLGLTRFDGNRFTTFSTPMQNSLGISNIHEDKNGNIWCHNFGGQIFRLKNNVLTLFEPFDWENQVSFPAITISGNNELVATHNRGIFVYDINTQKDTILENPGNNGPVFIKGITNVNGEIFCMFDVMFYKKEGNSLQPTINTGNPEINFKTQRISILLGTFKDTLYALSGDRKWIHAIHIQNRNYRFIRKTMAPEGAFLISRPNANEAWVCGKNKSICLTIPNKSIENYNITSLADDWEGNRWVSTLQNGLGLLPMRGTGARKQVLLNTGSEIINAVASWQNHYITVSNRGNILLIDSSGKIVRRMQEPNLEPMGVAETMYDGTAIIASTSIYQLKNLSSNPQKLSYHSSIKDVAKDSAGNFYVSNAYTLDKAVPGNENPLPLRVKRCFNTEYAFYNKTVYACFPDGLFAFRNNRHWPLLANEKPIFSPSIAVWQNMLLIGTISNGVYLFINEKQTKHLTTENGLLSNNILKVKFANGKAWMLTNVSLDEWNLQNNTITHHAFNDEVAFSSVSDFCINGNTAAVAQGNRLMLLPLTNGRGTTAPRLYIDYVIANSNDTLLTQNTSLPHSKNQLRFVLSGLSFSSGKLLNFQYRLLGADAKWETIPASQYVIDYPGLQPGSYTFQARAVAADGTRGLVQQFRFGIDKPWWKETWFYLLCIAGAGFLLYLFITRRIAAIKHTNALELEKINLQSQRRESMLAAIRSQMNPHFIFNALNTIQSYIYTNDEEKASSYLGKFSDLVRRILEYSQKNTIPLSSEIEMLQLYIDLEVIRFEHTMKAMVLVDPGLQTDTIYLSPMLIQPYVENAIKHGLLHKKADRILTVRFETEQETGMLKISIEDNGIGRTASARLRHLKNPGHASFATKANQNRLEILNEARKEKITISITDKYGENGQPAGTLVTLRIPL